MPASRILEGSLPERHPKAQIFSGALPQPKTEPERDIKGEALAKSVTRPTPRELARKCWCRIWQREAQNSQGGCSDI